MKPLIQLLAVVSLLTFSVPGLPYGGGISGGGGAGGGAPNPHPTPNPGHETHQTPNQKLSVTIANDLGLKLMRVKVSHDLGRGVSENTLLSPISASQALSMALNGTGGNTRRELLKNLGATVGTESMDENSLVNLINVSNADLKNALEIKRSTMPLPFGVPPSPVVTIANGAWRTTGATDAKHFAFSKDFQKSVATSYQAEVGALDFAQESSTKTINAWVNKQTDGLIKSIFKGTALKDYLWLLANATYFEGGWQVKFNKIGTQDFLLANGKTKQVQMIGAHSNFAHFDSASQEVIEIPFHGVQGKNYSFLVIAPKVGADFNTLQQGEMWQPQYWQAAQDDLAHGDAACSVALPEFAFNSGVDLDKTSPITEAMGLDFLFAGSANFSPMATNDSEPSNVKIIRQQTRIELDENGVKAAAVTVIGGGAGAAAPHPHPPCTHVVINRPFAFAIMDRTSKAFLFVGSVVEP